MHQVLKKKKSMTVFLKSNKRNKTKWDRKEAGM